MQTTVRKLTENDWETLKIIRLNALKTDPIAFGSSYEEEKTRDEAFWRSRTQGAIVAFINDEAVGLISYKDEERLKTKHKSGIYSVFVNPKYRGYKIGSQLLEEALHQIEQNKAIIKINLSVVDLQKAAIKLYESMGFKVVGKLSKELLINGEYYDELLMEKILDDRL